ncbi:MlaD family protein [Nocardia niigatensis]|uniref:MlaD family protein n=1 Tax=Nocardia niigatensis TaxID=209249 RepID=UPI0002F149C2|nr:MlaD family protein [Nocardia niigatensis]
MKTRALLARVVTAVVLMLLILIGIFRVIERPVTGPTDTYTAIFTDANGLRPGDDVRLYGVQVGKVRSVELAGAQARVRFTVQSDRPLFTDTKVAVRYQNLTGFRFLEIRQPDSPGRRRSATAVFGVDQTVSAFDITTLFNGLQPVLRELSPDDLNQFTTSLLAVIDGDGTGLGPALGAIERLSRYVSDRQSVLSTLVGNLSRISDHIGGDSGNAMKLLVSLTDLFVVITEKLPGLIDFSNQIPPVLQPLRSMLTVLGLTGKQDSDLDALLKQAFPDPYDAVAVFGRMPGLIQAVTAAVPQTGSQALPACSHGNADAPEPLRILITGQRIILCKS